MSVEIINIELRSLNSDEDNSMYIELSIVPETHVNIYVTQEGIRNHLSVPGIFINDLIAGLVYLRDNYDFIDDCGDGK